MYPVNDRILSVNDGDKVTLFCHGTDKRPNKVRRATFGLSGSNSESLELECNDGEFHFGDSKVSMDKLNKATCTRVMEPKIIKETNSDCSNGIGADGRENAESITLVKVGWNFGEHYHEQVKQFQP